MREVIVREWRDDLGIVHRDEVGELIQLEKGLKMLWESSDETCKNIEVAGEKILEIFDGWYVDKVAYPDNKGWKGLDYLIIEIRRDTKETCEGCRYTEDKYGYDHCRKCSRNWIDRYEKSEDE